MSDNTVQDASAGAPAPGKPTFSGEVAFNESITVFSGQRIPQYDKGPVLAYAARGRDKAPSNLFAMICEDHLAPRAQKASNYAAIINPSLVRLIASGVIDWLPAGREKYCFIYENTLGQPLMKDDLTGGMGIKPELLQTAVIRPVVNTLADMRDKDLIHGNIRPSNIFDGGSRNFEKAILGECLSMPVSYNQPVLYETINRGLTSPAGRGAGLQQDDLYSFGVTLAMMLRQPDNTETYTDEEIIERKIEEGTYALLMHKERLTGGILELLRGLLQDDESQRWNLDEVLSWLDGRRLSPKQSGRRLKASRPLSFNGEKYMRLELIARDINKNVAEAKTLIESGEVEQWLSRALEDKPATARYEAALKMAHEDSKGGGYAEKLVARVGIALHPEGPMRFRSVSVMPDGVGTALAEAFVLRRDVQSYVDFFMAYFITQWVDAQPRTVSDVSSLISKFDGARAYLRHKGIGMGVEKCLYALCPEIHCLSEKISKFHVRSPEEMMHAFEKMSGMPNRPAMFFDRHIIAFLSAKDRKTMEPYLHDLNAPEAYKRVMAEMKALATIQKRSQMERFPGIAGWIVDNMGAVYERIHDRDLQKDIKKKAERLKESGDLAKIIGLFDAPSLYQEDNDTFRKSMRIYYALEQESQALERSLRNESTYGRGTGHQVAAAVSAILAAFIILVTLFAGMSGGGRPF